MAVSPFLVLANLLLVIFHSLYSTLLHSFILLFILLGIHTDSDYFGSSLLYSRTFLHSYTLFMALQDTTSKMGATTICPGTQWCANEDLGDVCLPSREVMDQQQNNNHAFEVSSNGKTGRDVGLLYQGDGMMFNQNIWHRGPRNNDKDRIMNRVMFIVTFVSRQDHDLHMTGDVRQQGLGTYYYQRWNMWGHTYDDLKSAATRMAQPIAALRALGIWKMPSTQWGIPWLEHFARQLANDEDFFSDYELPDFLGFLDGVGVPRWLQGRRAILKEDSYQSQRERRELERLAREEDEELDWESFLIQLATNIKDLVDSALSIALAWYFIVNTTAIAVTQRGAGGFLKRTLMTFFVSGIFWMGLWHYVTQVSHLGKRIQMRDTWRQPFPEPPLTLDHLQRTTFPTRDDVLVGSRFDAAYLSSFNNVLDYHPGNLEFQTALQDLGSPDLIQAYMNQPVQGVTPRFLQQDWKTGFWSLMTHQKTKDYIARQVHTSQHLLVGRLDEHLKSVLADARFGLSRETIMAKKFTSQLAMEWQSVLYRNLISTDEEKEKRFTTTTTKPTSTKQSTLSVPKSTICSIPTAIDAPFIPKTTSTLLLRSVGHGDRVLALLGPSGQYLEATIGLAMTDDMVSVEFTMLNEMGMVPKDSIRPFARFVQGGLAQVPYFYGADDYDADDWRLVEILSINPFLGDATVRHLEADDDVDEEGRIVRDLNVEFIRRLPFSSSSSLSMSKLHYNLPLYELDEGDQVQARFGGNGEWFSARIDQVHSDGTFGVAYDDGDFEEHVALYHIKPTGVVGGKMKRNKNKKQTPVSSFRPGQRVMCLYENDNETKEWFPATIVKDHENGTYHVYYDDEESAYEVPLDEIRLLPEAMDGGEID
jgi:hypothetical protein